MTEEDSFVTKDETYAAVPFGDKFMIIHNGQQLTVCDSIQDAKEYILKRHKKSLNKKVKKTALSEILEEQ